MRALGRLTRGKVGILQQLRDKLGTRAADMYSGNLINFATYKKLSTSIAHNEHIARRGKLRGYITNTHHVNGERLLGVQLAPKSKAGPFQRTSHVLGQTRHNGATYRLYKVGRRRAR